MKITVGNVEIQQLVEMEGGKLIQESIPEATPEAIKAMPWLIPDYADENGNFKALVQSFLISSNGKHILVDTGNGNGKNRPTCPDWGNLHTDFLKRFDEVGVKPEEIDIVVCTHLHFDHEGWNTKDENGTWVPTFPNAKYLFAKKDYDYWMSDPAKEVDDDKFAFKDSVMPIIDAGLAELIEPEYVIDENIRLIPTPGHTPGHMSVAIESEGKRALISGDFFHHACQLTHPEWTMAADSLPEVAFETRKKMFAMLADSDILLINTHFANPIAGKVVTTGKGLMFEHE